MSSRTVSAATAAKLAGSAYEPGWLIDIRTPTPIRFSTRDTVTWNGIVFIPAAVEVRDVLDDSSGGRLEFNDATLAVQTLVRTTNLVGRRIALARFYKGATDVTDPIWFFSGYIAGAREEAPPGVTLTLSRGAVARGKSPARRIGRATGFTVMAPEGKVIHFRGSMFRLGRARA